MESFPSQKKRKNYRNGWNQWELICSNLSSENQKFSVSSRPQPRNVVFDGKESLSCPEDKNCVLSCDEMDLNKKWPYDQRLKSLFHPRKVTLNKYVFKITILLSLFRKSKSVNYEDWDLATRSHLTTIFDRQLLQKITIATEKAGGLVRAIFCDMGLVNFLTLIVQMYKLLHTIQISSSWRLSRTRRWRRLETSSTWQTTRLIISLFIWLSCNEYFPLTPPIAITVLQTAARPTAPWPTPRWWSTSSWCSCCKEYKKYHVTKFRASLNQDFSKWTGSRMVRENCQKIVQSNVPQDDDPKFGAGSVFGKDMKEESRLKKLGSVRKKYDPT